MEPKGRAAVIFNPVAGAGRGHEAATAAREHLRSRGWRAEAFATSGAGGGEGLARELAADTDLLVVAGGDGSLREAIQGLGEERARVLLGFVPIGNANVVARELAIPRDVDAAVALLTNGVPTSVDLGQVRFAGEDEFDCFLAVVGLGWDARCVEAIEELRGSARGRRWYKTWADGAYITAGLGALAQRSPRIRIVVDGTSPDRDYRGLHLCNFRTYAKGMAMAPDAHCRSGRIHYQGRKRSGPLPVAWHLALAAFRRNSPHWLSDYGDGREVAVECETPVAVQVDGDFRGLRTRLEVRVVPSAVQIIAPAALQPAP